MELERRAVIDIGTNSVKLLVAEVRGSVVNALHETSEQTRLGRGFYETHRLQPAAIEDTAQAVARFALEAGSFQVSRLRVIATSAARDALNAEDLLAAVRDRSGLTVEIITGHQEAEWVFHGVITDRRLLGQRLLILDVGGGSTEFILCERDEHVFRQSFALGSVRLMEKLRPSDPPSPRDLAGCRSWLSDCLNHEIGPAMEPMLSQPDSPKVQLVGTGGTASILARLALKLDAFHRDRIDGAVMSRRQILEWMVRLWSLPLEQRRQIVGLPPSRADIILTGVAIYEAVMAHFDIEQLYISTRGLRFGALLQNT